MHEVNAFEGGRLARLVEVLLDDREARRRAVEPFTGEDRLAAARQIRGSFRSQPRLDERPQQREVRDRSRHGTDVVEVLAHRHDVIERPSRPRPP